MYILHVPRVFILLFTLALCVCCKIFYPWSKYYVLEFSSVHQNPGVSKFIIKPFCLQLGYETQWTKYHLHTAKSVVFFQWTALVLSLTYVIGQSSSLRENYAQLRRNVDFNYKNLNLVSLSMFHPPTRGSHTYFLLSTNDSGQRLIYLVICLLADGFQWTLHYT